MVINSGNIDYNRRSKGGHRVLMPSLCRKLSLIKRMVDIIPIMYLVYMEIVFPVCVTILTNMVVFHTTVNINIVTEITKTMVTMELVIYQF